LRKPRGPLDHTPGMFGNYGAAHDDFPFEIQGLGRGRASRPHPFEILGFLG
jgi:hypothetical protein